MTYDKAKKILEEYWGTRNTEGCEWKLTKKTPALPGYVFVYKGGTIMRRVYDDQFNNGNIKDMLETVMRLAK